MSILTLQEKIREKKTPLALTLAVSDGEVDPAQLGRLWQNQLQTAAGLLPAVVVETSGLLPLGPAGLTLARDVLAHAQALGLYAIARWDCARPTGWLTGFGGDAVTALPWLGRESLSVPETDKAVFTVVRSGGAYAADLQELPAGDRRLWQAAAELCERVSGGSETKWGHYDRVGLATDRGFSLDIRDLRRTAPHAFLLLTGCDCVNAAPAFNDYGHGALVCCPPWAGEDVREATEASIREMKREILVV